MTTEQMNEYIMNYLENDKTKRAIMLDGPWGSGKSYYVENRLKKSLIKNGKEKCIVISLYGLNKLSDISVNIFLETKYLLSKKHRKSIQRIAQSFKNWFSKMYCINYNGKERSEEKDKDKKRNPTGKIIAKTVVKGIASYFNVDVSLSDTDLGRLYKTVDLTDKLVVLEDLERSSIPIIDVLGYVNNLTEQDNVKVLLVANEGEIINALEMSNQTEVKQENATFLKLKENINEKITPTQKQTVDYLRKKEKTVGDTIKFVCNKEETIKNIFDTIFFNNKCFDELRDESTIKELSETMTDDNCNWRSFLSACQKTSDIFDRYGLDKNAAPLDVDFKKAVLMSAIEYSLAKDGGRSNAKPNTITTQKEYDDNYEDFSFIKEYFDNQTIDIIRIQKSNDRHRKMKEKTKRNIEFHNVFDSFAQWYINDDNKIIDSLCGIKKLLKTESGINLYFYGELLQRLIMIKYYMKNKEFNGIIDECIPLMVNNIEKMSKEELNQYDEFMWRSRFEGKEKDLAEEYERCWKEISQKIREKQLGKLDIEYTHDKFTQFIDSLKMIKDKLYTDFCFLKKLDIDKFLLLLGECSAKEIETIRFVFPTYDERTIVNDKQYLQQLRKGIKDILEKDLQSSQRVQLNWFLDNLPNVDVEEVSAN